MTTPAIKRLRVENFRALRSIDARNLRPLTVLIGPNGSGKSTLMDVFAFVSDCLTKGLHAACGGGRGGFDEIRSRDSVGPIVVQLSYSEGRKSKLITYRLEIGTSSTGEPVVERELLRWSTSPGSGRPSHILDVKHGSGYVYDDEAESYSDVDLTSASELAVSAYGRIARHPRVVAVREFIAGWYLSYVNANALRTIGDIGAQPRLSATGDNLSNVLQYLRERHLDALDGITSLLRERVPQLADVDFQETIDGRLVLTLRDAPFTRPVVARHVSDGTMRVIQLIL